MRWLLIAPIRAYQLVISPLLGPRCRFYPSCSQYGLEAIQLHGPLKGGWMTLKRICKCHPLHPGGIDLVPPRGNGDIQGTTDTGAESGTHTSSPSATCPTAPLASESHAHSAAPQPKKP